MSPGRQLASPVSPSGLSAPALLASLREVASIDAALADLFARRAKASADLAGSLASLSAEPKPVERMLTPDEAAKVASIEPRQLARITEGQPFRRKMGHRTIRYDEAGLRRWLNRRAA
jgi:hypothetical protein